MTAGRPTFTVLVPTHERAHLLPRALESVLAQDYGDFELLVVDDASRDATGRVVAALADPRIRYLRRDVNGGAGASRNTGIQAARGRFISLLDDDDEYLPGFLEKTWRVLENAPPEVGLTWCGVRWVEDREGGEHPLRDEVWQPAYADREAAYRGFLRSRRVGTNCGLTFRRELFDHVGGFDESFRGGAEDTDLLIRAVRRYDFRVIPEPLVKVHLHSGANLRRVSPAKAEDYERLLEKHRAALDADPRLAAAHLYKTGWLHYHAGQRRRGRSFLLRCLRVRPLYLKAWAALILLDLTGKSGPALHRRFSEFHARRSRLDVRHGK